jgi:hypothetical protein
VLRVESRGRVCVVKKYAVVHKDSAVMIESVFIGVGCKSIPYVYFSETSTCTWSVLAMFVVTLSCGEHSYMKYDIDQ